MREKTHTRTHQRWKVKTNIAKRAKERESKTHAHESVRRICSFDFDRQTESHSSQLEVSGTRKGTAPFCLTRRQYCCFLSIEVQQQYDDRVLSDRVFDNYRVLLQTNKKKRVMFEGFSRTPLRDLRAMETSKCWSFSWKYVIVLNELSKCWTKARKKNQTNVIRRDRRLRLTFNRWSAHLQGGFRFFGRWIDLCRRWWRCRRW